MIAQMLFIGGDGRKSEVSLIALIVMYSVRYRSIESHINEFCWCCLNVRRVDAADTTQIRMHTLMVATITT